MFIIASLQMITKFSGFFILLIAILIIAVNIKQIKFHKIILIFKSLSQFEKMLLILALINLATSFIICFSPIIGTDTLTSRINNPKRYIQHGGFYDMPHKLNSNLPMGTEMLYMFSLIIFPVISVKIVAFIISLILSFSIYQFSKDIAFREVGILASILIISTPLFYSHSFTPLQDMLLALFSLLSLWCLIKYYKDCLLQNSILFGIFSGTTIAIKYNGIILVFILYILLFTKLIKIKKLKNIFTPIIFTAIFYFPWLIKAYKYTGNPLYPYLNKFFLLNHPYNSINSSLIGKADFSIINKIIFYFTHFFNMTIIPFRINQYYSPINSFTNPLIILLLLIAIYYKFWKSVNFKIFTITIFFTYTIHFFLLMNRYGPRPRWIFIVFCLLSIIGSWGFYKIKNRIIYRFFQIIILSWILFFTIYTTSQKMKFYPVVFGLQTDQEFHRDISSGFKWIEDFEYLNKIDKDNKKVLLFTPKAYYLDSDYVLARIVKYEIKLNDNANIHDLMKYLIQNNVKFIWFDNDDTDLQFYDSELLPLTKRMINSYNLKEVFYNEVTNSYIYSL